MEILTSNCPECAAALEFPPSVDNVICRGCGAVYKVSQYQSSVSLHRVDRLAAKDDAEVETELDDAIARIAEQLAEIKEEIETIRSREQGAALQAGCAVFGLFGVLIVVLAFFVTVGRSYFGGWPFFAALAAVLVLFAVRLKSKLLTEEQREKLVTARRELEEALLMLEADYKRLTDLRAEN